MYKVKSKFAFERFLFSFIEGEKIRVAFAAHIGCPTVTHLKVEKNLIKTPL